MRYRRKGTVEAVQWHKHGDHPMVVKPFWLDGAGDELCSKCGRPRKEHGAIYTYNIEHRLCPTDWIVMEYGEFHCLDKARFEAKYEVEVEATVEGR